VLLPLVIALGLAYIFNPVVTWAHQRLRLPRWAGTSGVMLGGLVVVLLALLFLEKSRGRRKSDYQGDLTT